jgi:Tol biopolymer transport system component
LASTIAACDGRLPIDAGGHGPSVTGPPPPTATGAVGCAAPLAPDVGKRWIAFDSDRANFQRQLYKVRADGSGLTRLLSDAYSDREPASSPDGTTLAFTSDRGGTPQIFLLDLASGKVAQLTDHPDGADQPSFSRDGRSVAFHSGASVFTADVTGQSERLIATGLDTFNAYFWPSFSADDTQLVFDRNNEIDAATIGAGMRMIVQNWTTTMKQPAVSPTGEDVAYAVSCEPPGASIWTTPFATTTDPCAGRRVSPVEAQFVSQRPAWGSTTFLAYERVDRTSNLGSITIISRDAGSVPCVIVGDGADNRNPSWMF